MVGGRFPYLQREAGRHITGCIPLPYPGRHIAGYIPLSGSLWEAYPGYKPPSGPSLGGISWYKPLSGPSLGGITRVINPSQNPLWEA